MNPLQSHEDYRIWLREWYRQAKLRHSRISMRHIGSKVDMDPSSVAKVMAGKLHLTEESVPRWIRFLGLVGSAEEIFRLMVRMSKSTSQAEIDALRDRLQTLQMEQVPVQTIDASLASAPWLLWALRARHSWPLPPSGLHQEFVIPVDPEQVEQTEALLRAAGLAGGKPPDQSQRHLDVQGTPGRLDPVLEQLLMVSQQALSRLPPQQRHFSSMTISLDSQAVKEIVSILTRLQKAVRGRVDSVKNPDSVWLLNIQFHPLMIRSELP